MSVKDLLDFGMVKTEDPLFPYSKNLSDDKTEKDERIELCVFVGNNSHEFVLSFPNMGLVYLAGQNVKDLEFVERIILRSEPF